MSEGYCAYGCGKGHPLRGTNEEQRREYAKIARIRDDMQEAGEFAQIERDFPNRTEAWVQKMDRVWEVYLLQEAEQPMLESAA